VTDRKVRIGIIGCGRIAMQGHLPHLKSHPDAELVSATDTDRHNCEKACSAFGIKIRCESVEQLLDDTKPDGIFICTPNWAHREITTAAAQRGIHVFCEKPMATNAAEAREMVDACSSAGVVLQIGMVKRFDAGIVKGKQLVWKGRLGKVSQIHTSALNPPARLDSPSMDFIRKAGRVFGIDVEKKLGLWRMTEKRTGGGQLLEMGTHMLDLALYFAGEKPASWSGFSNKKRDDMVWEDQGTMIVKFPSGTISTTEINMSVTSDNLIGENGRIYGDAASLEFKHIHGMWFGLPFYEYIPTRLTLYGKASPYSGIGLPVSVPVGRKRYMHKLQVDYFIDKILGRDTDYFGFGPDFAADGEDGLSVMRIIESAYGS